MIYFKRLQLLSITNWIDVACRQTNLHSSSLITRCLSSVKLVSYAGEKHQNQQQSYVSSYLINSCGLSPEIAATVSKKLKFETPEKADSVLGVLRQHGFTNIQISKLVRKIPCMLVVNVEKTLVPKIEFFHSVGISGAVLADVLSSNPSMLSRSLNNQIIPTYNFLKGLLSDNAKVVSALKRGTFLHDVQKNFVPNISALRAVGVQQSGISSLITSNPCVLCDNPEKFDASVKKVVLMELKPATLTFINALVAFSSTTKQLWEQKREIYRSWGWSEEDFWLAFRKYPRCMTLSVENISSKMDLFVNKMGWEPSAVARGAVALAYSLEKRIIPRWSVIRVLLSKGLIEEKPRLSTTVMTSDKYFIDNFVSKYEKQVPHLLHIQHGKISLPDLGFVLEQNGARKS